MARTDRLMDLIAVLRDGETHRACDLAVRLGVSQRTIYRDMDRLVASGVPIRGTRGDGYRVLKQTTLPPMTLTPSELDVLTLGIAIVSETADPDLKAAALSLADKIEAALPVETVAEADSWKLALTPLADPARGLSHLVSLRGAITGKQKLRLRYASPQGQVSTRTVRPLRLESWGRVWILIAWCELRSDFREFRTDLIQEATPLPELFVDEPGKRLSDRT
ncbi:YafY family transcriptional regulator [Rhodobacteraceae bacterium F11138]|nr:YafY family transcriptional regulator [Rhodobacteraceae bacterium F11138]